MHVPSRFARAPVLSSLIYHFVLSSFHRPVLSSLLTPCMSVEVDCRACNINMILLVLPSTPGKQPSNPEHIQKKEKGDKLSSLARPSNLKTTWRRRKGCTTETLGSLRSLMRIPSFIITSHKDPRSLSGQAQPSFLRTPTHIYTGTWYGAESLVYVSSRCLLMCSLVP